MIKHRRFRQKYVIFPKFGDCLSKQVRRVQLDSSGNVRVLIFFVFVDALDNMMCELLFT